MKTKRIITCIVAVLAIAIIWLLIGQIKGATLPEASHGGKISDIDGELIEPMIPPSTLFANEDGLVEVIIPPNLFGGENITSEEAANNYLSNQNSSLIMTSVAINEDGSITLFMTTNQLDTCRRNILTFSQFHKSYDVDSIREVIYDNDMLTEITVLVDFALYQQNGFEKLMCIPLLPVSAGIYQILTGIPPDEWHTTITIKDYETDKIISVAEFPNDDMYRGY